MGNSIMRVADVGSQACTGYLAGWKRSRKQTSLSSLRGMEGALPSVVGGLVDRPVIAVPTSVGYGAAFGGVAALLGMLTSCASNVCVVNIDNGFGAAHVATLINRL
jgi:NCAIR mutase (PurE)-related protein